MSRSNTLHLLTPRGKELGDIPWNTYPRPQMVRDSFLCLNGLWDFAASEKCPEIFNQKILVPFAPQSLLSGICSTFSGKETLFYSRKFTLPEGFKKDKILLHIGACDQECRVFVNGNFAGEHKGGYNSFCLDITSHIISGENHLLIEAMDDPKSTLYPYGKQCEKRGGMWYTPVAGIWQSVWLESVPESYIKSLKITTKGNQVSIRFFGVESGEIIVEKPDGILQKSIENSQADFEIPNPRMWSPESPYLYKFRAVCGEDNISSYFALRDLEISEVGGVPRLLLNGKPYYFHGLLDQGYFSDGIYTPASPESYCDDILAMKNMGFNMLRKHIKIEPEQFYYDCDRLGMVVFQDMVNNSDYSFLRDTALPTVGLKKLNDKKLHKNPAERAEFERSMKATVEQLFNHPCICQWTIFNEGWGQFCSTEMYCKLKVIDPTRFIDSASGWFAGGESDFESPHIYFKPIKIKPSSKPVFLSEFGGYSCKINGHCFNTEKEFGYKHFDTPEAFANGLEALYTQQVIPALEKGLCGSVYTQVSDVEDETNGLLTYDRAVQKISTEKMAEISAKLIEKFHSVI